MEEEIRQETAAPEESRDLCFSTSVVSNPWFYDNGPAIGVVLSALAVTVLAVMFVLDPNPITKALGILGGLAYYIYSGRYTSRRLKRRIILWKLAPHLYK